MGAVMDDYSHPYWPGVHDGVARFFYLNQKHRLAPVALIRNKLIITTTSHHAIYRELLATTMASMPRLEMEVPKQTLFDWPIVVMESLGPQDTPDSQWLMREWEMHLMRGSTSAVLPEDIVKAGSKRSQKAATSISWWG